MPLPSRLALLLLGSLSLAAAPGCRAHREPLYAASAVVGDAVLVRVADAHVRGDRVVIKASLQNTTDRPLSIDRSALALRLPDGRVLPGPQGYRARKPLIIAPGRDKTVRLTFTARGVRDLSSAHLVIGGVSAAPDHEPRTLGEIALSNEYAVPTPPHRRGARHPAEETTTTPSTPESGADAEDDDDAADDEDSGVSTVEVEDAPEERWVIGGG